MADYSELLKQWQFVPADEWNPDRWYSQQYGWTDVDPLLSMTGGDTSGAGYNSLSSDAQQQWDAGKARGYIGNAIYDPGRDEFIDPTGAAALLHPGESNSESYMGMGGFFGTVAEAVGKAAEQTGGAIDSAMDHTMGEVARATGPYIPAAAKAVMAAMPGVGPAVVAGATALESIPRDDSLGTALGRTAIAYGGATAGQKLGEYVAGSGGVPGEVTEFEAGIGEPGAGTTAADWADPLADITGDIAPPADVSGEYPEYPGGDFETDLTPDNIAPDDITPDYGTQSEITPEAANSVVEEAQKAWYEGLADKAKGLIEGLPESAKDLLTPANALLAASLIGGAVAAGSGGEGAPTVNQTDAELTQQQINAELWNYYQTTYKPLVTQYVNKVTDKGNSAAEERQVAGQIRGEAMKTLTPDKVSENPVKNAKTLSNLARAESAMQVQGQGAVRGRKLGEIQNVIDIGRGQATEAQAGLGELARQSVASESSRLEADMMKDAAFTNAIGSVSGAIAAGLLRDGSTSDAAKRRTLYDSRSYIYGDER
jgi:uncharacterized protein YjbJ (UPF0337 family)